MLFFPDRRDQPVLGVVALDPDASVRRREIATNGARVDVAGLGRLEWVRLAADPAGRFFGLADAAAAFGTVRIGGDDVAPRGRDVFVLTLPR